MKILWLLVVIHTASAQIGFGTPYFRNSRLCQKWSCVNTKLGFPTSLPTSDQLGTFLRSVLPTEWHGSVDAVLATCYHNRPRKYTNTCPGQAILHCAVDQLIANCPESYQRKEDSCAPINSIAGFQYMFTQSRYENIETNIAADLRPPWFLRNYFNTKCCNVPVLFNSTVLSECGFSNIIQYFVLNPTIPKPGVLPLQRRFPAFSALLPSPPPSTPTPSPTDGDSLQVVNLNDILTGHVPTPTDPLDCCDVSEFIQPSWRQECNFQVTWEGQSRLVIKSEAPEPTTTTRPVFRRDITVVPHTCEKETCVFTKLNITTNGTVDIDAFTRLLDNLTASQPSWTRAKGRALTTCLRKPLAEYTDECEINKVLACTFDVLTENCPYASKNDSCNHSMTDRTCQITSSKYRPKHRRDICILPELVDRAVLTECGLTSLGKTKPVSTFVKPKKSSSLFSFRNKCKDLTPSTTCLLSKMGVLNKYGFVDYFKMKDRIRISTANKEPTLEAIYLNAFNSDILYDGHCNSPKKLLNVLDSMLMTCPKIRSKNTAQCVTTLDQVKNSPSNRNVSQAYTQRFLNHFLHVYNPSRQTPKTFRPKHIRKIKKSPIYHYGILNDNSAPKVTTIDVKPKIKPLLEKPPLVLLPVYMRIPQSNLMIRRPFPENGVMRGLPMNNPTNNAHAFNPVISSTPVLVSTAPILAQRISTIRPFSTRFKFPKDEKLEMLKPE